MDKAKERAFKRCPKSENVIEEIRNEKKRAQFVEGYNQAKKDLELTWKDMILIHRCIKDAMNFHLYKVMDGMEGQKIVYQEVLKRFNNLKERKDYEN